MQDFALAGANGQQWLIMTLIKGEQNPTKEVTLSGIIPDKGLGAGRWLLK